MRQPPSYIDALSREHEAIAKRAIALLDKTEAGPRPVRLLGVSVHNFGATTERPRSVSSEALLPFDS